MSDWNQYVLTDKGRQLLVETGIQDNALTFLNLRTSSHVYTDAQIPALTDLDDIQGSFPFSSKELTDSSNVKLEAIVTNKDVTTAYDWASTGVYAADSNGNAVLFAVATAKTAVPMKPISESTLNQYTITVYLQAANAEKITIDVPMDSYVTQKQLQQMQTDVSHEFESLEKKIYNTIYPVGRLILDFGDTDPNTQFPWMTWTKVGEGSALITAGSSYKVGEQSGANSKPIPLGCLPKHKHDATSDTQGLHTHNGSTSWSGGHRHRFWLDGKWQSHDDDGENLNDVNHGGHGQEPCLTSTAGSHNHTVNLESAGGHKHTITVNDAGEGKSFDVMQQSIPVYAWRRTA